jgi:hypothetical protein
MHSATAARTPSVYVDSRVNPITLYTGIALIGIWLGVALTSIFAPSLEIAGARQQQDLPIPAMSTWVWGAIGTGLVLLAASRTLSDKATNLQLFGIGSAAVWIIAGLVRVFAPILAGWRSGRLGPSPSPSPRCAGVLAGSDRVPERLPRRLVVGNALSGSGTRR